jgi:ATP-binding cassette subfamily B protein/subfamily B ATP-binding cassette protein MsbA
MANRSFSTQDKSNLAWFVKLYLKPHVGALSVVFVVILSQAFVYQQFLSLTERGLRVIFEQGQLSELIWICGVTTAIFAVRAFGSYFIPVQSAKIAGRAVRALRTDLIQHLLGVRQEFFDRSTAGDVSLRLANQARDLGGFVGQSTVSAVRDALTIIVVSGYLIYKSPQLFAFAIVVIPMISVAINFASQRIKTLQRSYEDAYGHYMGSLDEMTSGMRTIKMTRQEASETQRLNQEVGDLFKFTVNLQKASAILPPLIDVASAVFYLLVIGVGGYFALSDQYALDGAGIISFLLGLVMLFDPAKKLGQFLCSVAIQPDLDRQHPQLPKAAGRGSKSIGPASGP